VLQVYASGGDPDSVAGEFGRHSLYKMLGYFSLVGLLRLHSLHGDYYQAIKVLEYIELNKKVSFFKSETNIEGPLLVRNLLLTIFFLYPQSQYSHVPACQVSMSYYVGFAYMMMRRYADAIRTFSSILLYVQRTKQLFSTRSYQNDQVSTSCCIGTIFHLVWWVSNTTGLDGDAEIQFLRQGYCVEIRSGKGL